MPTIIVQLIYDQMLQIIASSNSFCYPFNTCDFTYEAHKDKQNFLLDIIYHVRNECGDSREITTTIDYTNICNDDLVTAKWDEYIQRKAKRFIKDICPTRTSIVKVSDTCRPKARNWEPFAVGKTTVLNYTQQPTVSKPQVEVHHPRSTCNPSCSPFQNNQVEIKTDYSLPIKEFNGVILDPYLNGTE